MLPTNTVTLSLIDQILSAVHPEMVHVIRRQVLCHDYHSMRLSWCNRISNTRWLQASSTSSSEEHAGGVHPQPVGKEEAGQGTPYQNRSCRARTHAPDSQTLEVAVDDIIDRKLPLAASPYCNFYFNIIRNE